MKNVTLSVLLIGGSACGASLMVECENFDSLGGWVVDAASTDQMGSSYVMAHGYGVAVTNAATTVSVPEPGTYQVWARTRDWAALWRAPESSAPGRFRVKVNGTALASELGAKGKEWGWTPAGEVELAAGEARLELEDLTGFNGRCDALYLTTEKDVPPNDRAALDAFRVEKGARPKQIEEGGTYDLVVIGGGMAGLCAAKTAASYGTKVVLLQDRDVVGGCNSSEVRVGLGGVMHIGPYPQLGKVVDRLAPIYGGPGTYGAECYEDARKASFMKGLIRTGERVVSVERDPSNAKRIAAVLSRDVRTGRTTRWRAPLFVDDTGDGLIARWMGCETMYGREPREKFNESCAPKKGDRQVMGHSVLWLTKEMPRPQPFPDIDWGLKFTDETVYRVDHGDWEQEAGQWRDMAEETEIIRDYGLLSIFSNWSYLKNHASKNERFARRAFSWISPIGGKRESHRVVGDLVLTQNDVEEHVPYEDATAATTWGIDLHFPDPRNEKNFPEPFRSCALHRGVRPEYAVPYRCLYARDCENLFLAGRDISLSHVAFAAVRVMRTLGMLGEVVGMAADICRTHGARPREVYSNPQLLVELKKRMLTGVPVAKGDDPAAWKAARIPLVYRNSGRTFVLADESRGMLRYYDEAEPTNNFAVAVPKPLWGLTKVGPTHFRTVGGGGFTVVDLATRSICDTFRHPQLGSISGLVDLPTGGFLASVNPGGNRIDIIEFSKERQLLRTVRFDGIHNCRALTRCNNGELLISHDSGFVRARMPEKGEKGEILADFKQPSGRNLFEIVEAPNGEGYWAGTGYEKHLVLFGLDGQVKKIYEAKMPQGKSNFFYAQPRLLPNGHILVCNWTGHGEKDSGRGWQLIEFDAEGEACWFLDNPRELGSIHGVYVLD